MICVSKKKSYLKSQNLKIFGQGNLHGKVEISGAKNSALVLLASSLLTNERIILENVPRLTDIEKMGNILKNLGTSLVYIDDKLEIDSKNISIKELPNELVNGLRASFFCIGALLSKFGEAKVPLPGGCNIGSRPIDEHINGLKALGAKIIIEDGIVKAKIKRNKDKLRGTHIKLKCPSVGATETLIMAASLAEGRTTIENAAREPEIQDLCQMLNKMGAKIYDSGKENIIIDDAKFKTNNEFSLEIDEKFKVKNIILSSDINITQLKYKKLKIINNYFPEVDDLILLDNHKLNLNYKDNNLSINGEGQIQLNTDEVDEIKYFINKKDKDLSIDSELFLKNIVLEQQDFLKIFFPHTNNNINFNNQKLKINFKNNNLTFSGSGKFKIDKDFEEIDYFIEKNEI